MAGGAHRRVRGDQAAPPRAAARPAAGGAHRVAREPRWGRWAGAAGSAALIGVTVVALVGSGEDHPGATVRPVRDDPPLTAASSTQRLPDTRLGVAPVPGSTQALAAIKQVVSATPEGAAGVAAVDLTTGATATGGSVEPMWTASMYKLLVLETLLRQDGPLTGGQLLQATAMIEYSDNEAGYALFQDAGGNPAIVETLHRLGVDDVVTDDVDPTFTRITPAGALELARALVRPGLLSSTERAQALSLTRNVTVGQRWGVGVVADQGTDFANKNGWLAVDDSNGSDNDDQGRWIVTTVGVVTVRGHDVLIAAMSEHNDTEQDGIESVESLSRAAVALLGLGATG